MSTYEVGPDKPVMPSVGFIYGANGEVVGDTSPTVSPVVEAFMDGSITAVECFNLRAEEVAANQRLRAFMQGNQPPDFMPKIPRTINWRGWLKNIIA
jgi:hypothetical protein